MWYVFPQIAGLGFSETSRCYAIRDIAEARAYLEHPLLGPRLIECFEAALRRRRPNGDEIFGSPDDLKFRSCATLFACVAPPGSVFQRALDKYFGGEGDRRTLELVQE